MSEETAWTPLVQNLTYALSPLSPIWSGAWQQLLVHAGVRALLFARLFKTLDAPSLLPTSARLPLPTAYRIFIPAGERSS